MVGTHLGEVVGQEMVEMMQDDMEGGGGDGGEHQS